MANLKRDRVNMFKQFVNEDSSRKFDYNNNNLRLAYPSVIPPIVTG